MRCSSKIITAHAQHMNLGNVTRTESNSGILFVVGGLTHIILDSMNRNVQLNSVRFFIVFLYDHSPNEISCITWLTTWHLHGNVTV